MSRKLKARDKITRKMTKDGAVDHNALTGEDTRISSRETELDLRQHGGAEPIAAQDAGSDSATISQLGKSPQNATPDIRARRKQTLRHSKSDTPAPAAETKPGAIQEADTPSAGYNEPIIDTPADVPETAPIDDDNSGLRQQSARQTPRSDTAQAPKDAKRRPLPQTRTAERHDHQTPTAAQEKPADSRQSQTLTTEQPDSRLNIDKPGRLQFANDEAAPVKGAKPKQQSGKQKPQDSGQQTTEQPVQETEQQATTPDIPATPDAPTKPGKLQFTSDEAAPTTAKPRGLIKAERQMERASDKLIKAQDNLPAKKKLRSVAVMDEKSGSVRQRLQFEKTPISQGEHIKGALPLRPVKAATNFAMMSAHTKLFQAENENVSVKAAHRAEMAGEAGVRSALRFRKTAPYRKVAKLEQAARKKSINLTYRQALDKNPKLKSSMLSRMWQKRKIKKNYAKAAREAQKAAKRAKKAGAASVKMAKIVGRVMIKNPKVIAVIVLIVLLIFMIMTLFTMCSSLGGGGIGGIVAGTYLAEDADILGAQAAYAGMEADLQDMLDNYETLNPGFDEYVYNLDSIWHDPYVLIAILSAMHEGAWTLDEVQGTLAFLFDRQYTLTESDSVEVRTRPEPVIDPVSGLPTGETEDVEYDHTIRTVTLENFNLSHLPIYIMGEYGLSRYALFMMTLGNRPDLFPVSAFPHASYYREFLRYDVPQEYLDADPIFAGMIEEANKWLGMPYVWGGYSPVTSFDCSGYVSWVLNNSGWDIGRLGAQGLYNYSTPVSASNARPGDLIFFTGTYDAPNPDGVTHVGIYVGDGMMVHAGNPIGYVSIDTPYWQNHFFAFGRVY